MHDTESGTAAGAPAQSHLGFRIAVGIAGLVLFGLIVLLGSVALKQSATTQALDTQASRDAEARPSPARE